MNRGRSPYALWVVALTLAAAAASLGCSALGGLVNNLTGSGALAIQQFTANPSQIVAGSNTTLSWDVSNADSVTIDQGVGTVTPTGTKQVMPGATMVFTLLAKANSNTATASVQVVVLPASH